MLSPTAITSRKEPSKLNPFCAHGSVCRQIAVAGGKIRWENLIVNNYRSLEGDNRKVPKFLCSSTWNHRSLWDDSGVFMAGACIEHASALSMIREVCRWYFLLYSVHKFSDQRLFPWVDPGRTARRKHDYRHWDTRSMGQRPRTRISHRLYARILAWVAWPLGAIQRHKWKWGCI